MTNWDWRVTVAMDAMTSIRDCLLPPRVTQKKRDVPKNSSDGSWTPSRRADKPRRLFNATQARGRHASPIFLSLLSFDVQGRSLPVCRAFESLCPSSPASGTLL
jgi:hypothetical protein